MIVDSIEIYIFNILIAINNYRNILVRPRVGPEHVHYLRGILLIKDDHLRWNMVKNYEIYNLILIFASIPHSEYDVTKSRIHKRLYKL